MKKELVCKSCGKKVKTNRYECKGDYKCADCRNK